MKPFLQSALVLGTVAGIWLLAAPASTGEKKKYGLAAGEEVPFHVVDFVAGPRKGGGCPSVMISNARTRGVIMWVRTADDPFFELAQRLEKTLAGNPMAEGYFVVFQPSAELAAQAKKHMLERLAVGTIRNQSRDAMARLGGLKDADVAVFLLERKTIRATWSLKAADLDKQASDKIAAAADRFFQAKDEPK